ncbi:gp24 [Rhodococcus phage ReqiPine5]|uniref:Gp24 n=1 Tax=Rhodococcus phage ReqiPine5 TaxID=691963 RepID=D4P7Z9_9CAUD|nr:gp24 [Rhodococcus phage ReqiPine5]ADD81129.1 gp24 [Rhodococcus phage ReqiPine5]
MATTLLTIRGTATPCTYLPRGHVRVVAESPLIDRMIRDGYVEVIGRDTFLNPNDVETHLEEAVQVVESTSTPEAGLSPEQTEVVESLVGEAPSATNIVPRRNESRATWKKFLEANGVAVDPKWTRDQMIAAWGFGDEEE